MNKHPRRIFWALLALPLLGACSPAFFHFPAAPKEAASPMPTFYAQEDNVYPDDSTIVCPRFYFAKANFWNGIDFKAFDDASYTYLMDEITINGETLSAIDARLKSASLSWDYGSFPSNASDQYKVAVLPYASQNFLELRLHKNYLAASNGCDVSFLAGFSLTKGATTYTLAKETTFRRRAGWKKEGAGDYVFSGVSSQKSGDAFSLHFQTSTLAGLSSSADLTGILVKNQAISAYPSTSGSFNSDGLNVSFLTKEVALDAAFSLSIPVGFKNALGNVSTAAYAITYDTDGGFFYDPTLLEKSWDQGLHIVSLSTILSATDGYGFDVVFNEPIAQAKAMVLTGNAAYDVASGQLDDAGLTLYRKAGVGEGLAEVVLNGKALKDVTPGDVTFSFGAKNDFTLSIFSKNAGSDPLSYRGANTLAFPASFKGFAFYGLSAAVSFTYGIIG
jgi:hypothetical protein